MARVFINDIKFSDYHSASIGGFFIDQPTLVCQEINVNAMPFDPALSTSVRQQLQDALVIKFNETYAGVLPTIIASDIEYLV